MYTTGGMDFGPRKRGFGNKAGVQQSPLATAHISAHDRNPRMENYMDRQHIVRESAKVWRAEFRHITNYDQVSHGPNTRHVSEHIEFFDGALSLEVVERLIKTSERGYYEINKIERLPGRIRCPR